MIDGNPDIKMNIVNFFFFRDIKMQKEERERNKVKK